MVPDRNSDRPIYLQIYDSIASEIRDGYLMPGERLPSRRGLARELGAAERTVENAYGKLVSDGYAVSRPGSGFYVSRDRAEEEDGGGREREIYNFSSNGVETSKLPFAEWSRLLRATIKEDPGLFCHGEKAGERCLRRSIRRMLFRTQGIRCETDQIIIGPGAEDLLRDLFLLLGSEHPILMNNYYNYRVRAAADAVLMEPEYITSGADGIVTDELLRFSRGILCQKPTHDLPTGCTLDEQKRLKLLDWSGVGRYIIEDSDENDYRYGGRIKTLWELSGGRNVIYLGSFSKTIAPSMKIGYIIVPPELAELWFSRKRFYANRVSRIEQVTLSKFIDLGHYERHLGYMKSVYREKAAAFRSAVNASPLRDRTRISGDDAGTFLIMSCDIAASEAEAVRRLAEKGVKVSAVSSAAADPARAAIPENTYIAGFGELKISRIHEGVDAWAKAWRRLL